MTRSPERTAAGRIAALCGITWILFVLGNIVEARADPIVCMSWQVAKAQAARHGEVQVAHGYVDAQRIIVIMASPEGKTWSLITVSADGLACISGAGRDWETEATVAGEPLLSAVSARGLFRATGKASKPVAVRSGIDLAGVFEHAEFLEREPDEFYPTPPEPTRALLLAEANRLHDFPLIWEPAVGDGAMLREMNRAGHATVGSDLIDRGCGAQIRSFYDYSEPLAPAILTNPPFAECNARDGKGRWIFHALDVLGVEYMALLFNWSWPGAGGHARLWEKHPPARVYLMRWKIDFTGQGAPPMLNGWFVWDKAHRGETVLRMLDRSDARQSELFSGAA